MNTSTFIMLLLVCGVASFTFPNLMDSDELRSALAAAITNIQPIVQLAVLYAAKAKVILIRSSYHMYDALTMGGMIIKNLCDLYTALESLLSTVTDRSTARIIAICIFVGLGATTMQVVNSLWSVVCIILWIPTSIASFVWRLLLSVAHMLRFGPQNNSRHALRRA